MRKPMILRLSSCVLAFAMLLITLCLGACSSSDATASNVPSGDTNNVNDSVNTVAVSADDVVVPDGLNMTPVCKNGARILFADMTTGEFAIQDQSTGELWYSNPPDRAEDPYSGSDRATVFSLMTVHCLNTESMVDEYLNSYSSCVMEDAVTVTSSKKGLLIELKFVDVQITVPLSITLTDDGFKAAVDVAAVKEESQYKMMNMGLLPYFGAGGVEDDGYLVVPDGSGALIHFNNGKQSMLKYSNAIYGNDPVLSSKVKGTNTEYNALPLFGLKNGSNGFAAIISEGDAVASVNAGVSKSGSGYNNIYADFTLRSFGSDMIGGKEIRTYEKGAPRVESCEITYSFLSGDSANYAGIAGTYRTYLAEQMKVQAADTRTLSIFLELYGAIRVQQSVMGFPTQVTKPLTTFAQAETLVSDLRTNGVENLIVAFQDADTASLYQKIPSAFTPDSKLGGKKKYKQLKDQLDEWKIPLVSNVNLTTLQNSGNGYSVRTDTAELFTGLPGLRYSFKLNTGETIESAAMTYFLAPRLIETVARKFADKFDTDSYGNIGLDTLAKDVYSDFAKEGVGRQEMLSTLADSAAVLAEKSPLYLRSGNGRLLPQASYIYDMASDCSYFDLIDETIPLYQIAVSGLIPYSLEAINTDTSPEEQLLKCVEYGADLKFNFTYTDFGILGDPSFGYLNGTRYDSWKDYAVQAYKRLSVLNGQLGSGTIVAHEQVADGVFVTTYENGVMVAVNYNETEFVYSDTRIGGMDFAVLKGGVVNG